MLLARFISTDIKFLHFGRVCFFFFFSTGSRCDRICARCYSRLAINANRDGEVAACGGSDKFQTQVQRRRIFSFFRIAQHAPLFLSLVSASRDVSTQTVRRKHPLSSSLAAIELSEREYLYLEMKVRLGYRRERRAKRSTWNPVCIPRGEIRQTRVRKHNDPTTLQFPFRCIISFPAFPHSLCFVKSRPKRIAFVVDTSRLRGVNVSDTLSMTRTEWSVPGRVRFRVSYSETRGPPLLSKRERMSLNCCIALCNVRLIRHRSRHRENGSRYSWERIMRAP